MSSAIRKMQEGSLRTLPEPFVEAGRSIDRSDALVGGQDYNRLGLPR